MKTCWITVDTGECVYADTFEEAVNELYKFAGNLSFTFTPENLLEASEFDKLFFGKSDEKIEA
jgi:hypothetical protein